MPAPAHLVLIAGTAPRARTAPTRGPYQTASAAIVVRVYVLTEAAPVSMRAGAITVLPYL